MVPTGWNVISSILFAILRQAGFRAKLISVFSQIILKMLGYGLVDDVDLLQTNKDKNTIIKNAEKGLKLWEGGLRATGGSLATIKSFWCVIPFEYKDKKWRYQEKEI